MGFDSRGGTAVHGGGAPAGIKSDFLTLLTEKMAGICGMMESRRGGGRDNTHGEG